MDDANQEPRKYFIPAGTTPDFSQIKEGDIVQFQEPLIGKLIKTDYVRDPNLTDDENDLAELEAAEALDKKQHENN